MTATEVARCYSCGEHKPVGEFSRDPSKASGRSSRCRACDRNRSKAYYAENRERVLARHAPAAPRENVCAGCGEPFTATGFRRYCDRPECRPSGDRGAKVEAVCDWCGEPFEARARDRSRGLGRYCCKSHALQDRSRPGRADGAVASVPVLIGDQSR